MDGLRDAAQVAAPAPARERERHLSGWAQVGHFTLHLVEMCAAMCVGMVALGALSFAVAHQLGVADPLRQYPEFFALVMACNMSLPMAAWMHFRGMAWRPIAEMSGAMFGEVFVLIGASWLGVIPPGSLVLWQHTLMLPAMVVAMLFRLDLYTGRVTPHAQHAAHAA